MDASSKDSEASFRPPLLALKLFAVLLAVALGSVALTAWRIAGQFEIEFTDYLRRLDVGRLEALAGAVANEYQTRGNLDHLQRGGWRNFHERIDPETPAIYSAAVDRGAPPGAQRPPPLDGRPPRPTFDDRPPRDAPGDDRPPRQPRDDPANGDVRRNPPPRSNAREFYGRTSLLTVNGDVFAGRPGALGIAWLKRDVVVDTRTVAVVAFVPLPRPAETADLQLLKTLRFDIFNSAALAVAGALLLALVIATLFARRIKAVGRVATRIASGDLAARAPADGADELARLGSDLNRMAVALETQEGMRRRWLANVAHELRTPLTVLRGEVEALQDGVRVVTPQALQSLADEVVHLGRITDDLHLLAMDDLDALPIAVAEVEVSALATRAVERWAAAASRARLQLTVLASAPASALADAGRLQQVLDNLIANSVRYTDSPGTISVQVVATAASVMLSVDDSTPGVPLAQLLQLFEPLYRVDTERSREKGGSGLGLAVCRAIVRALRGEITATSSPLGGLRIVVSLPRVVTKENQ